MPKNIDYKTQILELLKSKPNEYITRDELMVKTGISKSRLSEIIKSISNDGYSIDSPSRSGLIKLDVSESSYVFPTIKDSDIRKWLILFLLSKYEKLTFRELLIKLLYLKDANIDNSEILIDPNSDKTAYDNNNLIKNIRNNSIDSFYDDYVDVAKDIISVTSLRSDLNDLKDAGIVSMIKSKHTTYQLTSKAPYIIPISEDSLFEFCLKYERSASSTSDIKPLKQAYGKIQKLINIENDDINLKRFGKSNDISPKQIDAFNNFTSYPYKTNLLELSYSRKGEIQCDIFAVGLLFYSVETGEFYVLGKNILKNRTESRRIDRFLNISPSTETHNEFHANKYYRIFEEMFSSQYEEKIYNVKVLFQDFGNVKKRFQDLKKIRSNSNIKAISSPPENCPYSFVYTDTIRGLSDFARYLRGFGMSVLAVEPSELKEKMLFTYERIIKEYGEFDD